MPARLDALRDYLGDDRVSALQHVLARTRPEVAGVMCDELEVRAPTCTPADTVIGAIGASMERLHRSAVAAALQQAEAL